LNKTDVSDVHIASIIRAMMAVLLEAVCTSETSVYFCGNTLAASQNAVFF
jgi:hypothetical protein